MPGESNHETGREGVRKAKLWLDGTTRANVLWTVYDGESFANKLSVKWANGNGEASFDLFGVFLEGDINKQPFYAEVKNHNFAGSQLQSMYKDFLALCYRACVVDPHRYDHFIWMTWSPGNLSDWPKQTTVDYVSRAVRENAGKAIESPKTEPDEDICRMVAGRIWYVIFGPKQHELVTTAESRAWIMSRGIGGGFEA